MVHQYQLNGYNIAVDVDSGSVHVVDELVYEIIALYEQLSADDIVTRLAPRFPKEEIRDAFDDVETLIDQGMLFSNISHEVRLDDERAAGSSIVKALCLNVAHS